MESNRDNQVADLLHHHLGMVYEMVTDLPLPLEERNALELRLRLMQDLVHRIPESLVIEEEDYLKTIATLRAAVYWSENQP